MPVESYRKPTSFTCPQCGRTSHNPRDVEDRYCGACHIFFDDFLHGDEEEDS